MAKSKYDKRRENFIRQYAKFNNISISEARRFHNIDYEKASDKQRRKIMKSLSNKIKDQCPKKHPALDEDREKKFKLPKEKVARVQTVKQRKAEVKRIQTLKQQTRGHKTQQRVIRAAIKHGAGYSKFELQHGIRSVASQEYRARHK